MIRRITPEFSKPEKQRKIKETILERDRGQYENYQNNSKDQDTHSSIINNGKHD